MQQTMAYVPVQDDAEVVGRTLYDIVQGLVDEVGAVYVIGTITCLVIIYILAKYNVLASLKKLIGK